ncbi:LacI family DNA-binding transcriptional regulator [Erythrobacter dokdonensis]|uniref:Transcriptional regulator, LacI family protein n=1 Tax=Erythrobacter dokdonensis DSW-74 TaxID=1300349 RepID=A0A1A7BEF5_9SPHN|nr:LacI family DNA-binding transcriptional regulator [Erythrobacter dokdonensis]OBV10864.1 Transcriptional regulator, LacI family protein [Erythrobacter dokdonensis DSW-74]
MGKGITIEDVASAAGVSRQTVSRVMNQSPRVSPEARTRVEQAIAALGYVPSLAARSMAGGRSRLLLAVFESPSPETQATLGLDRLLPAGTLACSPHGYRLLLEPIAPESAPAASDAQLAATIGAVQPDGAILLPPLDSRADLRAALESRKVPVQTLHGTGAPVENPGEAAAQHLLDRGHRQIGFITGPSDPGHAEYCLAGYRSALARKGSRAHRHFVAEDRPDLGDVLDLARAWLVPTIRPTAIITMRSEAALAVLHVAQALKLAVPRDLSLIALEDDPALARSHPPVAALHDPAPDRFAAACTRMITALENRDAPRSDPPVSAITLTERASLARAPRAI